MSLDNFTISAIIVSLLTVALMVAAMLHSRRRTERRLRHLEGHLRHTGGSPWSATLDPDIRELCGAIHRLYPCARFGEDFELAKRAEGAVIGHWRMPVPEPDQDELARALQEYRQEQEQASYRVARQVEYPAVTDQLDALYQARQGNAEAIREIDRRIARVKARHPKPGEC